MADLDADSTPGLKSRKRLSRDPKKHRAKLFGFQERLYAEHKRSLLIVLQGMDTGGKDGTITHVIGGMNPQGVSITAFKQPTPEERRHGFLWRIRKRLPEDGQIGIFNRSHYEDVLVARVHALAKAPIIERRYGVINRFERDLVRGGTKLVKICLLIFRTTSSAAASSSGCGTLTRTGSSKKPTSTNAPSGMTTRALTASPLLSARPNGRRGTSSRRTTRTTGTGPFPAY